MADSQAASAPATKSLTVTVRFFAAARSAAGRTDEAVVIPEPGTVGDVLAALIAVHGFRLAEVLRSCSYLLGETAVHGTPTPVTDGDILDVLPPFAGG